MMKTLFCVYEGTKPFIKCTVLDEEDRVLWSGIDTSIGNHVKMMKTLFHGYRVQPKLPGVKQ